MSVSIRLPDSSVKKFPKEVDVLTLAESIGPKLAENAVGAFINSSKDISDVRQKLKDQDQVEIIAVPSKASLEVIRHSSAHVMAQAVQELWPETKVTIGPVIEDGFYYDFDREEPFSDQDLQAIENKMKEILKRKLTLHKEMWPSKKAIEIFNKIGETYKIELIEEIGQEEVSVYKQGDWFDLCKGPHVQHLGQIGAVKILSHSACYWRADEAKASLQRIYGTAFHNQKDLDQHLHLLEEAKKRDHRKIGKEMDLFYFSESAPGHPFFKKSGTVIYREIEHFLRQKYKTHGYEEVISPQLFSKDVFEKSGHLNFYSKNIYAIENQDELIKPMNCPGHCLLYKSRRFSYKDLPWRVADFGRLHRFERSGTLHGLSRVRSFCQDDAHIFCAMEQLKEEIQNFIRLLKDVYQTFALENYEIHLCTRPKKRMGEEEVWDQAESALSGALSGMDVSFTVSEGEGAFYGPKLDIMVVDSVKRKWQLGTLQCDFNLPQAFRLGYNDQDNKIKQPVLIHRAVLGSIERFIGIYTEHCSGWFPTWLAPVQAVVMNISRDQKEPALALHQKFQSCFRSIIDDSDEKLSYKIRKARLQRIPYMVILGKKEAATQTLSVRAPDGRTKAVNEKDFLATIKKEINERKVGYSSF